MEIVAAFQFERIGEFQNVCQYGDKGDKFYIVLKGLTSVQIPNPLINNWHLHRKKYMELLEWKKEYLDPKIDHAIKERYEQFESKQDHKKAKKIAELNT